MKGTEKQIVYATALREQFIAARSEEIETQKRMIASYRAKMAVDPSRDYSAKIAARTELIEKLQARVDEISKIEDAGEIIDTIRWGRA